MEEFPYDGHVGAGLRVCTIFGFGKCPLHGVIMLALKCIYMASDLKSQSFSGLISS